MCGLFLTGQESRPIFEEARSLEVLTPDCQNFTISFKVLDFLDFRLTFSLITYQSNVFILDVINLGFVFQVWTRCRGCQCWPAGRDAKIQEHGSKSDCYIWKSPG